ncbi:MAG: hypothetical protein JO061_08325 [Acidobacteriaceae bacterium]|nr:hypothetical protein [Acidobacteriaceae bacterium]
MSTSPQRHNSQPEITPEDERIIQERIKTYDRDKKDTVDARERLEQSIRERNAKHGRQPH